MNERALRPGNVAAAALVLGGVLMIVLPQHGASIVRLVIVTIAVAAGVYAFVVHVPEWSTVGSWMSPFSRAARAGAEPRRAAEVDRIRAKLSGRRQRIDGGPPVPPDVLHLLQPLIMEALERQGIRTDHEAGIAAARRRLSHVTWAVLTHRPVQWPRWFKTVRPDAAETAAVVHDVLDDLERLTGGPDGRPRPSRRGAGMTPNGRAEAFRKTNPPTRRM